MQDNFRLI